MAAGHPGRRWGLIPVSGAFALSLCILFLGACQKQDAALAPAYVDKPVVSDSRTHLMFAVHPLHNAQLLHQKFQPLMDYLDRQMPPYTFDLDTSADYAEFERKLKDHKPQLALPNPYHALLARDWGYRVIAKMGNDDVFRGIFLVRKDSELKNPVDLKGKVVSYPAPTALAAAMMPQLYLEKHGVSVETDLTNRYVGTHNSSIMNVYLGESAAAATWPTAWESFKAANPTEASQLRVIWETPKLIQNAVIADQALAPDVVDRISQLLVGLVNSDEGRELLKKIDTSSFVSASDADFNVVSEFLKEYNTLVKHRL
jgi:phosphonate transport system substrate-binding protein